VDVAVKGLIEMIKKNDFYLKEITDAYLATLEIVRTTMADVEARLTVITKDFVEYLNFYHAEIMTNLRDMKHMATEAGAKLRICLTDKFTIIRTRVETLMEEVRPRVEALVRENLIIAERRLKEFIAEAEPKIRAAIADTVRMINTIRDDWVLPLRARWIEIRTTLVTRFEPLRLRIIAVVDELIARLNEVKAEGLTKALNDIKTTLEARYAKTSAEVVAFLAELNTKFEAAIKEWEGYPYVKELKDTVELMKEKLVWAWGYVNIPGEFNRLIKEIEMKNQRFWNIIEDNKSALIAFDKTQGVLEFNVELPIALKELAQLPTFDDLIDRIATAKRELTAAVPKVAWTLKDYYYYYRPRAIVPPFETMGIVAGNQHFFTFDGSFFEFAGDCSYVLARDFTDKNFSVILNYRRTRDGPRRNSITVMAGDKTVEIFNTFKTVVDKTNTELPIDLGYKEITIKRASPDQILIESKRGITVACSMSTEICTVRMSGWYYGKTGGLLGTYDYEPTTDMTAPTGKRMEDIERFANTWEVAKTCSDRTNYAKSFHKIQSIETTTAYATCRALFMDYSSTLRPAFRVLDPANYMNMCINDVFEHQNNEEMMRTKACISVAAYMAEAEMGFNIMLEAPASCMTCGDKPLGHVEKVTRPIMGVDTVVIVEENICNKEHRKDLLGLISNIEKALSAKGLKDNQYGLAAFGGPSVHNAPHFHTIDSQLFNTDRKFVRGVRALEFAENTPNNHVEAAIEFAAREYPWRAGAQRNVIVLSCSTLNDMTVKPMNLAMTLKTFNVRLHYLHNEEFVYRNNKEANMVLGFDHSGAFITKDTTITELEGNANIAAQLKMPKTPRHVAVLDAIKSTRGSFFTTNSLVTGRVRDQKKLMDVFSRRVALTSIPEKCQVCECQTLNPYTMKTATICKPCF